eukprot:scaffold340797_cov24-Attheya_sp.AAC.1
MFPVPWIRRDTSSLKNKLTMADETGKADGGDRTGVPTHTDNRGWIFPLVSHALDRHPVSHEARQHP